MSTEIIISICSTVIALAALFLAVYEGRATRRHNRLSVMPHLTMATQMSVNSPQYLSEVINNGVGPAVIKKFAVFLDDRELIFEAGAWRAIIDLLDLPKTGMVKGISIDKDEMIPSGARYLLLQYDLGDTQITTKKLRQQFRRIKVDIAYESIYGDKFNATLSQEISIFDCFESDI